jgi:hypothetical protein
MRINFRNFSDLKSDINYLIHIYVLIRLLFLAQKESDVC